MRTIIGISGKAGSGKDTSADFLIQKYGFRKYSMAKPLKDMLRVIDVPCDTQAEKAEENPIFGCTNRHMAITLGTEWMRELIHPDGWVRLARKRIMDLGGKYVVIPDIRYDNEARMIRDMGGRVIQIDRPSGTVEIQHKSEAGISPNLVDFFIENTGTVEQLHNRINETFLYIIS